MNNNLKPLQAGLSFNNGVFEALISDASTWNVDAKTQDRCDELRIFPPSNMLESRKVTDTGPLDANAIGEGLGGGRGFSLDKPIGLRQTAQNNVGIASNTQFDRTSSTWPVRITQWPKRDEGDRVINYRFEFYEPTSGFNIGRNDPEPAVGSANYSNPKRGREELCVINSGADSDCRLRRINRENRGANGSTIGGTA